MSIERTDIKESDAIFVAGHRGLAGQTIVELLKRQGYRNLVLRTHQELDLLDQRSVFDFFRTQKIDHVILAAARVGGIYANSIQQVDFLYENITIEMNVIRAAADNGVKKLVFLGSSCIYPKHALQPIREDSLLSGPLEPTNEGYALAKIAGLKLCHFYNTFQKKPFVSLMPSNLYGPGDNFHPDLSHVIPGIMRRFHEAKTQHRASVTIWGTGNVRREFLYVDDLADATVLALKQYRSADTINVGRGEDITIRGLVEIMKQVVDFSGKIEYDTSKPDGTPRKLLDISRIRALGWGPKTSLEEGLRRTYQWAVQNNLFAPIEKRAV